MLFKSLSLFMVSSSLSAIFCVPASAMEEDTHPKKTVRANVRLDDDIGEIDCDIEAVIRDEIQLDITLENPRPVNVHYNNQAMQAVRRQLWADEQEDI